MEALENIPTMTATERLVELLRNEESKAWQKADATLDAVNDGWEGRTSPTLSGVNSGLQARIVEVWEELVDADLPEQPAISTVSKWYGVAKAWPPETRVKGASYMAHYVLMGDKWKNRQAKLSKIVAQVRKRRGPDAYASRMDVELWKQAQEGAVKSKPWEDKFWGRLDSLVHSRVGPKSKAEWNTAIGLVETLLNDMRTEAQDAE